MAGIALDQAVQLGVARLQAGWNWEALRLFRSLQRHDDKDPMPHLLLALATRDEPNRAARHCYDALHRAGSVHGAKRALLDAYQAYFGVTTQPELQDARFQKQPSRDKSLALLDALGRIRGEGTTAMLASNLAPLERRLLAPGKPPRLQPASMLLTAHNAYLRQYGLLPFMVPGYAQTLSDYLVGQSGRDLQLARLPRHPQYVGRRISLEALPGLPLSALPVRPEPLWRPPMARPFELPSGVGGTAKFSDYSGKPVLVIFFLGFGCAHCVAQLTDLDPRAPKFRAAGIEVVTIGSDDLNQVRAARQAADENGVDPLHFDVLCDPNGEVFKQWGVWDEFSNEALHGSFLVDGKGRILWQDVSVRPFEESDWLLAESQRLLAAWQ